MSPILVAILIIAATVLWFAVALLPALHEHFSRTDVNPLRLNSEAADIRFFAFSFRQYVEDRLTQLRARSNGEWTSVIALSDDDTIWYAARGNSVRTLFEGVDRAASKARLVGISEVPLRVADGTTALRELYVNGALTGGSRAFYRAALVDGDVTLGEESTVARWIDAAGGVRVGARSTLWGRASSSAVMFLDVGTRFQRIGAPRIEFGAKRIEEGETDVPRSVAAARQPVAPPPDIAVGSTRWVIDGDFAVPYNGIIDSDIVVSGTLTMGSGSEVTGAIRAARLIAEDDCVFGGAIVAEESAAIGARALITGPVVVEGDVAFGEDCEIGEPEQPTTVSVVSVHVRPGVVLSGELWARGEGCVLGHDASERDETLVATAAAR